MFSTGVLVLACAGLGTCRTRAAWAHRQMSGGGWFYPDDEGTLPGGKANVGFTANYKDNSELGVESDHFGIKTWNGTDAGADPYYEAENTTCVFG